MGTDIYMKWKDQSESEKKKQITGFSIECGKKGYLRASVGMYKENSVLRDIFPEEYWETDGYTAYDFETNYPKCIHTLKGYIASEILGLSVEDNRETHKQQQEMVNQLMNAFASNGVTIKTGVSEKGIGFEGALTWANSLVGFFELGCARQKEGLKPEIFISW